MPRPLRPALVATVSLTVAACASAPPAPAQHAADPTAPSATPALPAPTQPATASAAGPFRAHPRDASGRVIYRRKNGSCFIEVVESEVERRIRFDDIACAPVMSDLAYQACDNGEIRRSGAGCLCAQLGNPPKPPFAVGCPER